MFRTPLPLSIALVLGGCAMADYGLEGAPAPFSDASTTSGDYGGDDDDATSSPPHEQEGDLLLLPRGGGPGVSASCARLFVQNGMRSPKSTRAWFGPR